MSNNFQDVDQHLANTKLIDPYEKKLYICLERLGTGKNFSAFISKAIAFFYK